jgi:hypothetical protein
MILVYVEYRIATEMLVFTDMFPEDDSYFEF